ncbi:MAG: energy transducer TonB [Bacteroidota bacterium]
MTNKQKNVMYADWEEMVFQDRERTYGAYELRRGYARRLMISLSVASVVFISATVGPYVWNKVYGNSLPSTYKKRETVLTVLDLPPVENKEIPPVEMPPPPKIEKVKVTGFQIPKPSPEDDLDEEDPTIIDVDELKEAKNLGLIDVDGEDKEADIFADFDGDGDDFDVIRSEVKPGAGKFIVPDQQPECINLSDIKKLIGYPQIARDAGIKGSVVVRILIDKKGRYEKHIVLNTAHPILSKAVEKQLPNLRFTPAIQGKKPIYFWVNVPFNFELLD